MTPHGNLVAGERVSGADTNQNLNPSNLADVVGEYARPTRRRPSRAIAAARDGRRPAWARGDIQARADVLDQIGNEILARKDELGTLLAREEGKTQPEGIGEAARAGYIFKFFAGEVLRLSGRADALGAARRRRSRSRASRVGVVGIITPWNFPIAIPAWKIAPALAYGNCVVFKPADLVPGCAWALAEIIASAGLPAGRVQPGDGPRLGRRRDARSTRRTCDAISFTGSVDDGRAVAPEAASRAWRKVQLEMGGKNPLVVLDDADLDDGGRTAPLQGAFFSTGQRCTASSRLIVTAGHPRPLRRGADRAAQGAEGRRRAEGRHRHRPGGRPEPARPGPAVHRDRAQKEGAKLALGRRAPQARDAHGFYLAPALFTETTQRDAHQPRGDLRAGGQRDPRARTTTRRSRWPTTRPSASPSGIATTSLKHASHFKRNSQAGMVMVNLPTAGVDYHVPFGGRKGSSYGPREQGRYAVEFYTTVKTAYIAP